MPRCENVAGHVDRAILHDACGYVTGNDDDGLFAPVRQPLSQYSGLQQRFHPGLQLSRRQAGDVDRADAGKDDCAIGLDLRTMTLFGRASDRHLHRVARRQLVLVREASVAGRYHKNGHRRGTQDAAESFAALGAVHREFLALSKHTRLEWFAFDGNRAATACGLIM